jgi:hypothetical protein
MRLDVLMYSEINQVYRWHCIVILTLAAIHLTMILLLVVLDRDGIFGLARLFRLEVEANVPTLFSAFALIACCVASSLAARAGESGISRAGWIGSALIFGFLAADEAFDIHARANELGRIMMGAEGSNHSLWYVPYAGLALAAGAVLLPWWLRLKPRIQLGLLLSGILFVFAAIGFEIIEGWLTDAGFNSRSNPAKYLTYYLVVMVEEALEMFAVALALRTILEHLGSRVGEIGFRLAPSSAPSGQPGT